MNAPIRKTGTMISMPCRMPYRSAMPPTMYSTISPGRMNSDAIENPSDRTFGGIASESDAKMPGASSAASPEIRMLANTATQMTGASANRTHAPRDADGDERQQLQPEPWVLQHEARRERDPEHDADDTEWLGARGDDPSLRLREVEDLLVVDRRQGREADHRGGEERQREPDAPQRADLPQDAHRLGPRRRGFVGVDDLGLFGAARFAFEVAASRLLQLVPRSTNTIVGTKNTKNGTRQPNASARMPPTSGPMTSPTAFAMRWKP